MLRRRVVNAIALISIAGLAILDFFIAVPWWSYPILLTFWFLITLCGSFLIRWDYHLKSFHTNKNINHNWVSITFDDGPNSDFTPKVLQLLKQYKVKATFFCIGKQVQKHPEILKQIISDGHSVGNHTYSHSKSFGFFTLARVKEELQKTKSIVKDLTGFEMNLYRPAFAVTNPMIEQAVKDLNLKSIGWSVRSLDTTSRSEKMTLKRITSKVAKGDIILLHDTSSKTIAVLERLLVFLHEKKLESVTVERLLEIKAYA